MATFSEEERQPIFPGYGIPRPVPDNRQRYQKIFAVYLILISTLLERIAFYTLAANLVRILRSPELEWKSQNAITTSYIFSGTSYVSTFLFAAFSDARLGRVKTIIIGFILYLTGYTMVTITTTGNSSVCHFNQTNHTNGDAISDEQCSYRILATLIFTAIGVGAVQCNMAVLGAEQIQKSKVTSRYFDKYIVAVNIGSIIATFAIPYIQTDTKSYYTASLIATAMLFVAFVLFIIGNRCFIHVKLYDAVIMNCIPVVINAFQSWDRDEKYKPSIHKERMSSLLMNIASDSHSLAEEEDSTGAGQRSTAFLDYEKVDNGGRYNDRIVKEVKSLRDAIIIFSLLVPYWLIYNQMDATFSLQGQQMTGSDNAIWISLGDPVTIIIGILILNMCVYKYLDVRKQSLTILTKFVIGMSFAFITMCTAGIIEVFRQEQCDGYKNESGLPMYALLPQYILMGFSEFFAMVASYEFAYFAAPRSAQSLFMSLHFCSVGISSFIGSAYIHLFPTVSVDLDFKCQSNQQWSFYTYFYILAVLQLLFVFILIIFHKKFQILKFNPQQLEQTQFLQHRPTASLL